MYQSIIDQCKEAVIKKKNIPGIGEPFTNFEDDCFYCEVGGANLGCLSMLYVLVHSMFCTGKLGVIPTPEREVITVVKVFVSP